MKRHNNETVGVRKKKNGVRNRHTRDTPKKELQRAGQRYCHTRDAIPGLRCESPVFYSSTTPTNLPTRIFGFLYYSLQFRSVAT